MKRLRWVAVTGGNMKNFNAFILSLSLIGCANDAGKLFSNTGGSDGEGGSGGNTVSDGGGGSSNLEGGGGSLINEGGSTGSSCVPKTCATIAVELNGGTDGNPEACGSAPDGCGGYVDCGGCSNHHHGCGVGSYNTPNTSDVTVPGIKNLCGGNCVKAYHQDFYFECVPSAYEWLCSSETSEPPTENCFPLNGLPSKNWCCN